MERLFERPGLPAYGLPARLRARYGGDLGFSSPRLFANFVSSLDGVVAIGTSPPSVISAHSETDRFVMGLLRACADAVLIGAGTLRAEPAHRWTPQFICLSEAEAYGELRRALGKSEHPRLVVLSTRGDLDVSAPAFELGALVVTTVAGVERLSSRLPAASKAVALSEDERVDTARVVEMLRADGDLVVLTEGGPTLIGTLLRARLLDELFLTLSPLLVGRGERGGDRRLGLVEGTTFAAADLRGASLLSVRRDASHLFLRYAFD